MINIRRDRLKSILVILGLLVAAGIAAMIYFRLPYAGSNSYYCPYCRATRVDSWVLFIKLNAKIGQKPLSRYWLTHIDKNHEHTWRYSSSGYDFIGGGGVADGPDSYDRRILKENTELSLLKSFKTPAERKAFVHSFLAFNQNRPSNRLYTIVQLNEAYYQNPARKDWQKILKQLGIIK